MIQISTMSSMRVGIAPPIIGRASLELGDSMTTGKNP